MSERSDVQSLMQRLDQRSRDIFREIVEGYLATGEPVGSRTLSRSGIALSPASIRNVMADLTDLGLLDAPHISAGRAPTHKGLRLFVDGFLEYGDPSSEDKKQIDDRLASAGTDLEAVLGEASDILSGLAGGAGLVASPARDAAVRHVEFVPLASGDALCVLVTEDGDVENRIKELKLELKADRLSCSRFLANQFRLLLHTAAYVLFWLLRRHLRGTELETAQVNTLRIKLLKIGARLRETCRRIWVHLASGYPYRHLLAAALENLRASPG